MSVDEAVRLVPERAGTLNGILYRLTLSVVGVVCTRTSSRVVESVLVGVVVVVVDALMNGVEDVVIVADDDEVAILADFIAS